MVMCKQRSSGVREIFCARRVLIVDDSPDCADLFRIQLDREGYDACAAYSAEEGLLLAAVHRPQVAILNMTLLGMDGFELIAALRKMPELERCVFIALTCYDGAGFVQRSRGAGFAAHLVKPVEIRALLSAIAAAAPTIDVRIAERR